MPQPYSIDQALATLSFNPAAVLTYLIALPALTFVLGSLLKKTSPRTAAVFATVPTHLAVLQGVSLLLVLGYTAFILRRSLLSVSVVTYYLPLLSSAATLFASQEVSPFEAQPGFERLSGLCVMAAFAFGAFFILDRLHFFAGVAVIVPLAALTAGFVALSAAFQWAGKRLKK